MDPIYPSLETPFLQDFAKALDPDFFAEHGPGESKPAEACIPGSPMYLFIKDTLKNKRSKVRTVVSFDINMLVPLEECGTCSATVL